MNQVKLRLVSREDAPHLQAIYAPYAEHRAVNFDFHVPEVQDFELKIEVVAKKYPFLVCVLDD